MTASKRRTRTKARTGAARTVIVAYDVRADQRRNRVHKLLLDFGVPIQYSVFECRLEPSERARMWQRLEGLLESDDAAVLLTLCGDCERNVERHGHGPVSPVAII